MASPTASRIVACLLFAGCTSNIGAGPSGAGGGGGDDDVSGPDGSGSGLVPLDCDDGFTFTPYPAETSLINKVEYRTMVKGYVYVGIDVSGPGQFKEGDSGFVSGPSPWVWEWEFTVDEAGTWEVTFVAEDPQQEIASCRFEVINNGDPPAIEPPVDNGDCSGKVCGQDDGAGGTCDRCPMVGSEGGACLDPPSPIGPGGQGSWSCLDNAGCTSGGSCKIWCPFEKCTNPNGCPNRTEACWVPATETDYESACRSCCQSYGACWDDQFNTCRSPGDCGTGIPPTAP